MNRSDMFDTVKPEIMAWGEKVVKPAKGKRPKWPKQVAPGIWECDGKLETDLPKPVEYLDDGPMLWADNHPNALYTLGVDPAEPRGGKTVYLSGHWGNEPSQDPAEAARCAEIADPMDFGGNKDTGAGGFRVDGNSWWDARNPVLSPSSSSSSGMQALEDMANSSLLRAAGVAVNPLPTETELADYLANMAKTALAMAQQVHEQETAAYYAQSGPRFRVTRHGISLTVPITEMSNDEMVGHDDVSVDAYCDEMQRRKDARVKATTI